MEEEKVYDYATFGDRLVAIIIDGLIIGAGATAVGLVLGALFFSSNSLDLIKTGGEMSDVSILMAVITYLFFMLMVLVGGWLYFALQESSERMATIGKRAMGIVVTDLEGNRITFARATGRYFGKILSQAIMYVGYIMAAFTERKQALHDMISNCLVMKDK
jgi:uncharacterized RDD family membrane protein YckC